MSGRPPQDLVDAFVGDVEAGMRTTDLAVKYGRAPSTISEWKKAIVGSQPDMAASDCEALWQRLEGEQDILERRYRRRETVDIQIDGDKPVAVGFWGDLQIGHDGVDYRAMRRDFRMMAQADGLYTVGMGDYIQNAKAWSADSEVLYTSAISDPDLQQELLDDLLQQIKPGILAMVDGNHDARDRAAGRNMLPGLCKKLDTVYLWHGGLVRLHLGNQVYTILARHSGKGESATNTTAAQKKAAQVVYPAEIICFGHKHFNDMQVLTQGVLNPQQTVYLRSGSYLVLDDFGQKIGGYRGQAGIPVVILWPDKHKKVPFYGENLEDALEYLQFVRR